MATDSLFTGLPAVLVEELLAAAGRAAKKVFAPAVEMIASRDEVRRSLEERSLIRRDESMGFTPPDVCGVAGSFSTIVLPGGRAALAAAFGVEGLLSPNGEPRWDGPRYSSVCMTYNNAVESSLVLEAVAAALTAEIVGNAPHTVVLLGSPLAAPFLAIVDALRPALKLKDTAVSREFVLRLKPAIAACASIADPASTPRLAAGMPPHSGSADFSAAAGIESALDDETLCTLLLEPGEYTAPVPADSSALERARKLPVQDDAFTSVASSILGWLERLRVVYVRPREWTPAMRVELPSFIAERGDVLALFVRSVIYQCASPGLRRPYPLARAEELCGRLAAAGPSIASCAVSNLSSARGVGTDVLSIFFTP